MKFVDVFARAFDGGDGILAVENQMRGVETEAEVLAARRELATEGNGFVGGAERVAFMRFVVERFDGQFEAACANCPSESPSTANASSRRLGSVGRAPLTTKIRSAPISKASSSCGITAVTARRRLSGSSEERLAFCSAKIRVSV